MSAVEKWLWNVAESRLDLRAGFICEAPSNDLHNAIVISSFKVPLEPFNGAENRALIDVLIVSAQRMGVGRFWRPQHQ
jgi:hypothetical protein